MFMQGFVVGFSEIIGCSLLVEETNRSTARRGGGDVGRNGFSLLINVKLLEVTNVLNHMS